MTKTGWGIVALVGVAAGSFAYWFYASLTEAERREWEDKAVNAANKLIDGIKDVQKSTSKSIKDVSHTVVEG